MTLVLSLVLVFLIVSFYILYRRFAHASLDDLPGPPSNSWLFGNFAELFEEGIFEWSERYGRVVRIKGALGQNALLISDPKALHKISNGSGEGYFPRHREHNAIMRLLFGENLVWADADTHIRHRKIMNPGYSVPETRAFVPLMASTAAHLVEKWHEIVKESKDGEKDGLEVNVFGWLSKAALDFIGDVAFDCKFNTLDCQTNKLVEANHDLALETFGAPSNADILFLTLLQLLPARALRRFIEDGPISRMRHARRSRDDMSNLVKEMVREREKAGLASETQQKGVTGTKDVISLCMRANAAEKTEGRLSEDEMIAQLRVTIFAGHETTANTLSWALYTLASRPEIQRRLREAIVDASSNIGAREWTWKDYEDISYLDAFVKETLRFYPVAPTVFRETQRVEVLSLSRPLTTPRGRVLTELPVPKGAKILLSAWDYNRNKDVFGPDADVFRPERWLEARDEKATDIVNLGLYENMMTFSAGPRACIGWRFAVLEIHAFLVEMLRNFKFSPGSRSIERAFCDLLVPMVAGEKQRGSQLPLKIESL